MTPTSEASVLPGLPKTPLYLRSVQLRQPLEGDMPHTFAGSLQNSSRIIQVGTSREPEVDMSGKYADVADAVPDDVLSRAIQQDNLRAHLEDVLMTRSHLLVDHLPKAQSKRLDPWIVAEEELEQLAWRFRHASLANRRGQLLALNPTARLNRPLDSQGDPGDQGELLLVPDLPVNHRLK